MSGIMGAITSWISIFGLLIIIYSFKITIAKKFEDVNKVKLITCILYVVALGYIYLLLADWKLWNSKPIMNWVGTPLMYLPIPIATSIIDIISKKKRTIRFLVVRSVIEVAIIIPLWYVITFFIFGSLGWFWI